MHCLVMIYVETIFTRIEIAILPVQGSDCCRSAGIKEAVENLYPLVSFGPALASGENIFLKSI